MPMRNQTTFKNLPRGSIRLSCTRYLTIEHNMNYVLPSFREGIMFRAVVEEAAALTSIALFLGMVAVWAQVLGTL